MFESIPLPMIALIFFSGLLALGNAVWGWRFSKLSKSYEQARVALGGSPLRTNGRSPLVAPGWSSVVSLVVVIPLMWLATRDMELPSFFYWWLAIILVVNVVQVAYSEIFSKWARTRRLLRRAVFTFDEESRELAIREALAADPDVGEKARAAGGVPGVVQVPVGVAPDALVGPRLSDAPPPL